MTEMIVNEASNVTQRALGISDFDTLAALESESIHV